MIKLISLILDWSSNYSLPTLLSLLFSSYPLSVVILVHTNLNNRGKKVHTVAGTFFELLVLKSRNLIDLDQEEPYADILIQKTV